MAELYNEYPVLTLLVLLYAFLALVKVTICLSHLPTASLVIQSKNPEYSRLSCAVLMGVTIMLVIPFLVVYALRTEGWRFFFAYSEEEIIKYVTAGFEEHQV